MKLRIKTYAKKEKITQKVLAERMEISTRCMTNFMSLEGGSVTSDCYTTGMKYFKTRMRLADCTGEDVKIVPTASNFTVVTGGADEA